MRTTWLLCAWLPLTLATVACSDEAGGNTDKLEGAGDDGGDGGTTGTTGGTDGTTVDPNTTDDDGDGFTEDDGDCDDANPDVNPDALEYCNNRDDDCDGDIDNNDNLAEGQGSLKYADSDNDGYGDATREAIACEFSEGWVDDNTDCDDTQASAYPGGTEVNWNGIDEDCDGEDFDISGCLATAVANTAAELESGSAWEMADFEETYDASFTLFGFTIPVTGAGLGKVENQKALITDLSSAINLDSDSTYLATFETDLEYNDASDPFIITVGIAESYWDFDVGFGYTVGDLLSDAIELVTDLPDDFRGTVQCQGYVDATPSDFDGTAVLTVDPTRESVTAVVSLESNVTSFTEGDTNLTSLDGGQCANDIINAIAGYIGFGDTYRFLNDNLVLVGESLVDEYETRLSANIEAECSGG